MKQGGAAQLKTSASAIRPLQVIRFFFCRMSTASAMLNNGDNWDGELIMVTASGGKQAVRDPEGLVL